MIVINQHHHHSLPSFHSDFQPLQRPHLLRLQSISRKTSSRFRRVHLFRSLTKAAISRINLDRLCRIDSFIGLPHLSRIAQFGVCMQPFSSLLLVFNISNASTDFVREVVRQSTLWRIGGVLGPLLKRRYCLGSALDSSCFS